MLTVGLAAAEGLSSNIAPNPSFEIEAKRLGGWLPLGVEATNTAPRLQTHGTVGQLRARLRTWQQQIDADSALRETLAHLPVSG